MKFEPPEGPMITERQVFALHSLAKKVGLPIPWNKLDLLTKREASIKIAKFIDMLEQKK